MQTAVNYFAVFGGLDIKVDTTKPLGTLITRHILKEYDKIQKDIENITNNDSIYHKLLSGIALGDGRVSTTFKRADLEFDFDYNSMLDLEEMGLIKKIEPIVLFNGQEKLSEKNNKFIFTTAFLRFWFAFISPLYRGISKNSYDEFFEKFGNHQMQFMDLIFEQLCQEYIKEFYKDDIKSIGSFWNESNDEIQIVAKTKDDKTIVTLCKYNNQKIKTKQLHSFLDSCESLDVNPDIVVLFSKEGFSTELKAQKSEQLRLFTVKSLKALIL
ncbi:hypothetical protein CRV00_04110 [Malaciobacter molluscorum]|uniref:DUF234 domain-containing protein n=1 Tax=Malaciobacter molluscorum TaxID=1032072 RepID=UPI00100A2358|nr:DUF234 domain-containing protein [Malaciobacter molluscorum]RXJ95633.1 hypothetical protein CRV00_04110 [Malaciobacter molluscorum]